MSATITHGGTLPDSAGKSDFYAIIDNATISGIANAEVASGAAIVASKLDLSAVAQSIAMSSKDITEAKGADVASATTTTIWVTDGNFIHITGTTTITSFGTAQQAGDCRTLVFDGALTLTHNATSLILPTGANITTAAGDTAIVRAETTANARVISYVRKDGTALVAPSTLNSNYILEGYATGRNVLRKVTVTLSVGGTPGTNFNVSATDDFNGPTISSATNLAKSGTSGSFSLNAGGTVLTMDITQNCIAVIANCIRSHRVKNASTTAGDIYFLNCAANSNNIDLAFTKTGSASSVDITTMLTTASDAVVFDLCFITST